MFNVDACQVGRKRKMERGCRCQKFFWPQISSRAFFWVLVFHRVISLGGASWVMIRFFEVLSFEVLRGLGRMVFPVKFPRMVSGVKLVWSHIDLDCLFFAVSLGYVLS